MKDRVKHFLLFVPFVAAMGWATFVFSAEPEQSAISTVEEMDQRIEEIVSRVGMSAPLEAPLPGESDFATEKLEEGWIIEATLEEVETALQEARNTPSAEDDIAAMRLAHRGSYRFFLEEAAPSQGATENLEQ